MKSEEILKYDNGKRVVIYLKNGKIRKGTITCYFEEEDAILLDNCQIEINLIDKIEFEK